MIRVAVAARSEFVRTGLEALLRRQSNCELIGSFGTVPEAFARAADAGADVLVAAASEMDLDELESETVALPLVLVADESEPGWLGAALRAGVRAVLPATAAAAEWGAALHAASAGLVALRSDDLGAALAAPPQETDTGLTPREREILQMLAEGLPNKSIAWNLGISEHTVKFHVASILNRLNAASRAQAVAIGIRRGLIVI